MRILGVKATVHGHAQESPCLYVSNHRSMLDPYIELHHINAHIVSKAEVAKYPLVGYGAGLTGVIYVQRDKLSSRTATRDAIREVLEGGESVLIYPEGTTSGETLTQEFRKGSFEVAITSGIPIVPVAIGYGNPEDNWADGPLFPFFLRKFAKRRTYAELHIGSPLKETSDAERALTEARDWINTHIEGINHRLSSHSIAIGR